MIQPGSAVPILVICIRAYRTPDTVLLRFTVRVPETLNPNSNVLLELVNDGVCELAALGLAAQVAGAPLALRNDRLQGHYVKVRPQTLYT